MDSEPQQSFLCLRGKLGQGNNTIMLTRFSKWFPSPQKRKGGVFKFLRFDDDDDDDEDENEDEDDDDDNFITSFENEAC